MVIITLQYDAGYTRHIITLQYDVRYTRHIITLQYDAQYTRHIITLQYDARYTRQIHDALLYKIKTVGVTSIDNEHYSASSPLWPS